MTGRQRDQGGDPVGCALGPLADDHPGHSVADQEGRSIEQGTHSIDLRLKVDGPEGGAILTVPGEVGRADLVPPPLEERGDPVKGVAVHEGAVNQDGAHIQRPRLSMIKRAVSPPEKFCWPVMRFPSRTAKLRQRPACT